MPRNHHRFTPPALTLAVLLIGSLLAGCHASADHKSDGPTTVGPGEVAKKYLADWSRFDYSAASALTSAPGVAKAALSQAGTGLGATKLVLTPGSARVNGSVATYSFVANWTLKALPTPWRYGGQLSMKKVASGDWRVAWTMSDIVPKAREGDRLAATRSLPDRAPLLDSDGKALFTKAQVVVVGIEPRKVKDLNRLSATLAQVLKISASAIVKDVKAAQPDQFVTVITMRRDDYMKVRSQIHELPGTVFQETTRGLPPTPEFGRQLLGRVGPATADVLKELGPGYGPGDQLGTSGLQAVFNQQLAGTAATTIQAISTTQSNVLPGGAVQPDAITLATVGGKPGTPVKLTIDRRAQTAADSALGSVPQQASVVAIRPSDGAILAVANSPSTTYDLAMQGQVPPGSTFKIITATSELANKVVAADAKEPCPGSKTINGKTFHNEDSFDLGTIALTAAFAHSCNTTFATLSQQLSASALPTTAKQYGIGAAWNLPVTSYSGQIPQPVDATELAADAIGQGRVLASPFAMALVAATVAKGSVPDPSLVAGQPAKATHPPTQPPAGVVGSLRTFMRATVTEGTASALRPVAGDPVYGKTGTAEYGTKTPPDAHAWFVGYQGDVAFACFVYGGQSSKTAAVPLAKRFLDGLH